MGYQINNLFSGFSFIGIEIMKFSKKYNLFLKGLDSKNKLLWYNPTIGAE